MPSIPPPPPAASGGGGSWLSNQALKSKQNKILPGEPEQVDQLVKAIKAHKGFKQMAQYNVSCLLSHITPPTVGWQENVRYAIESGAIESLIDVLKAHPNAIEVVRTAIEALRKLAIDAKNAEQMARAGAVQAALDAMLKSGDDQLAEEGGELVSAIAAHAPDAILDSPGVIEALIGALRRGGNTKVMASVLTTLDRVARTDRGEAEIRRLGGLAAVLATMDKGRETTEDTLRPAFRILERFARDPAAVKELRQLNGVEILVSQLEKHANNDAILRAGGRLLAAIAAEDLEDTINKLNNAKLSPETRQFMVALISNLALRPENIDKIIKHGGIRALTQGFHQFNDATKEAAARALARLANSPENIEVLFKDGAVEALVAGISGAGPENEAVLAACAQALANMALTKDYCKLLESKGAPMAVFKKFKEFPHMTEFADAALQLFENMARLGHDMTGLVTAGLVKAIIEAMQANPLSTPVQLRGFSTLEHLLRDPAQGGKTGVKVSTELIGCHGVPVMGNSLVAQSQKPNVVEAGLKTYVEFLDRDPKPAHKACTAADSLSSIVNGSYPSLIMNPPVRAVEEPLKVVLSKLATAKDAEAIPAAIKKFAMAMIATKSDESADKLEHNLHAVTVFSKSKVLTDALMKAGAPATLISTMHDVIQLGADLPRPGDIVDAYCQAIISLAKSDRKNAKALVEANALKVVQEPIKSFTLEAPLASSLKALRVFAGPPEYKQAVVDEGGIESCVTAMRTQPNSSAVFEPALEVLLQVSAEDELAAAVANKGGTRQVIKGVLDNCNTPEFERATESSMLVLEKVANVPANHKTVPMLVKQGAVDAVIKAMEAFPRNELIESVGARVLAKLLDAEGVADAIDKLNAVAERFAKKPEDGILPDFSRNAATVGFLAVAPENVQIMRDKGAGLAVLNTLKNMDRLPEAGDQLVRERARKAGFRALGQMAVSNALDSSSGTTAFVLQQLKNPKLNAHEKTAILECVRALAASQKAALELIEGGAVDDILKLMRANPHDEAMMTAALAALAALAEHESGAQAITRAGGLPTVLKWFNDNKDTASPRAMEACMTLLANLALVDQNVPALMQGGIVDMVIAALDALCSDPTNPQPRVLHAAVALLGRVAQDEKAVKELVQKGAVRRAIEIARSSPTYMTDPAAMEALIFLIESCALIDSLRPELLRSGAAEMITEAMNLNAASDEIVVTGARALQTLMGSSGETVKHLLKEIADLSAKLKKAPNDRDIQDALERALQNLANLTLMQGLVDSAGAAEIAHAISDLIAILSALPNDNPAKARLLAKAAQALGRLPLVEGVSFDESEALRRLIEALRGMPDDADVVEQILLSLANLLTGPRALKTLAGLKGIDDVLKVLASNADDPRLRDAAARVIAKARDVAENNPESIDPLTLAALLHATNADQIRRDFLKRMAQKGGIGPMIKALGLEGCGDITADLLRALREHSEGNMLPYLDAAAIRAILEALRGSPGKGLNAADALEAQKEALRALGLLGKDALLELARQGGVEALLKMMMDNINDPGLVLQCLDALRRMAEFDPDLLNKLLASLNGVEKIKEVLAVHGDKPEIVKAVFDLLKALGKDGLDKLGVDESLFRTLTAMNDKYPGMLDAGDMLNNLRMKLGLGGAEMISAQLDRAMAGLEGVDNILEMKDDDGKVYYWDKKTNEKTWQKPQAYAAVISAMEGLAKLTEAHKEAIQAVNPKALTAAVGQLGQHANEPARLTALAKALATLATNPENRAAIAKAGGLQAVLQALMQDNLDKDFSDAAVNLLVQFSRNDDFKDQVAKLGGIAALIRIMLKFIDSRSIVDRCLSALANLAYNSDSNVAEIVKHAGIAATLKVMQRWKDETTTLQLALVLLNNLMYGSDDVKIRVGKECSQEVVNVLQRHFKDVKTYNAANRAMGNLSVHDANIRLLVDAHAVKHIVAGMDQHTTNVEALQIAIDVIGNFASLSEDNSRNAMIAKGEAQSVFDIIVLEGGASRIIKCVKDTTEVQLLMSGMDALANLANDQKTTEKMLKMGIVPLVVNAMSSYDWDSDLSSRTVRLLASLTFSREGVKEIVAKDGIQVVLTAMESHSDEPEFLRYAIVALKNIGSEADHRAEMEKLGAVETVLSALEQNIEHRALVLEIIQLFIRLTMNKAASEQIATRGMHLILKAVHGRANDPEFLTRAFILLGHLAFHEPNLKIIAQYGGVSLIVDQLSNHAEQRELVLRAVQTLDNIAMASQEHSNIVRNEQGAEVVRLVMGAYLDDPEVTQVCKSALITMTALETRQAKPRRNFLQAQEDDSFGDGDPLAEYRNLLKAGSMMTEWSQGGPHPRHILILPDFSGLAWRDPKKSSNLKGANQMPLRDIRVVRSGAGDGHKKFGKKAKPENSFTIVGRSITLDLEAADADEAKMWVQGLLRVIHCVRRDPKWLR